MLFEKHKKGFFSQKWVHFWYKKSHFEQKLACFELEMKHDFLREISGLNLFITHTKPAKSETKILVWYAL